MRLALKINRIEQGLAFMDMHVNAARVSGNCGITMRMSELKEFLLRVNPDLVEVDREMITDNDFHRLAGFSFVRFL